MASRHSCTGARNAACRSCFVRAGSWAWRSFPGPYSFPRRAGIAGKSYESGKIAVASIKKVSYMNDRDKHIVANKVFSAVWAGLLALTALTITIAELHLGRFSIFAALAIASIKASLVLWFFMHLKYERGLFKALLLLPIATLFVII